MSDLTEDLTYALMSGKITDEQWDLATDIHLFVIRQILCPISGAVMDSRTAQLVVMSKDGTEYRSCIAGDVTREQIKERVGEETTIVSLRSAADVWQVMA